MVNAKKFEEEDALGYRTVIFGRHIEVTEAMKNYIHTKLGKIERFHTKIMDIHFNLESQRIDQSCTIIATFEHFKIKVSADSTDMYASIDNAIDKLQTKLSRWKDKIEEHHRKDIATIDMDVNVIHRPYDELEEINSEIERETRRKALMPFSPPKVMGTEKITLKTLTTGEAVMKIDLSGDDFLIFLDEADRKFKVIYRRPDGHYAIVQAE